MSPDRPVNWWIVLGVTAGFVLISWSILNGPWWPTIRDWIVSLGPVGG